MKIDRLVLGVLDLSDEIGDRPVADKFRDLTISWSRYDYRGDIIEAATVNAILDRAAAAGYRWCLVLPYGHIIAERWKPEHWQGCDFSAALGDRVDQGDFLVAGTIVGDDDSWYGFENECLLVNLEVYRRLSSPSFDELCPNPVELPKVERQMEQGRIAALLPSTELEPKQPEKTGWHFIAASLREGIPVVGFSETLRGGILDLAAKDPVRARAFANYLNEGVVHFDREQVNPSLSDDQTAFLKMVQPQTTGARNGVFLWNIEAYEDIEIPREDFEAPLTSLYSVAAGFKPNRILHTHGSDKSTRVVYFDYSRRALEVKQYMVEHWDGENFPRFVKRLFEVFPHPQTFYQLWDGVTPDNVDSSDIDRMWQRELNAWGGADNFRDHWQTYVKLPHEYVDCNIMADPSPLFERIDGKPNAVIWWSNAFFTVFGNWFCTLEQRKMIYDNWVEGIASRNPDLYLFGSDYNNVNVNSIRAGEYWDAYQRAGCNWLVPCRVSKTEMRM